MDETQKPTKQTSEAQGEYTVEKYENGGQIVRAKNGKFLPGTKSPQPITQANAREINQRRQDLTARLMRDELVKRGRERGTISDNQGPSAVVAVAAADLFEQVAQNPFANPRYRAETWQMIGRHAGLLGDNRQNVPTDGIQINIGADVAAQIVAAIVEMRNKTPK